MSLRDDRLRRADEQRNHIPEWFDGTRIRKAMMARTVEGIYREDIAFAASVIPKACVEPFKAEGWKTVYQTGPTWHLNYAGAAEDVLRARTFNDERLFGGPCREALTFALLQCAGVGDSPDRLLNYILKYGDYLIVWKGDSWVNDATVTWGDSQQNIIAWQYSEAVAQSLCDRHAWAEFARLPDIMGQAMFPEANPYLELQIHRQLTLDDVDGFLHRLPSGRVEEIML